MPAFYENTFIRDDQDLDLSENLKVKDFMCKHCNRLKISKDLVHRLTQFKKGCPLEFYVVKGYLCKEWCMENNKATNRSHTLGVAVDIHFGGNAELLDVLDTVSNIFPYVGLTKLITGEFVLHLQVANNMLYWVSNKHEDGPATYRYFKNYRVFRKYITDHPELYADVKI